MYSQDRGPLTVAGVIVFGFIYSVWLIELPPFSWWDSFLMWFYGYFLDWVDGLSSGSFWLAVAFAGELVFAFFKYFFLASVFCAAFIRGTDVN